MRALRVSAALAVCPTPASAQALGAEFQVNDYTTGFQWTLSHGAVAADGSGNFIVVWSGGGPGDSSGVFGRRFDSAGKPLGDPFRANFDAGAVVAGSLRR